MKELINREAFPVTDIWESSCQYPDIVTSYNNEIYISWQDYKDGHDCVYATKLLNKVPVNKTLISGKGEALRPISCCSQDAVWFIWSEYIDGQWSILARYVKNDCYSDIITLDTSEAAFYPCACDAGDKILIFWSEQTKGRSTIVMKALTFNTISEKEVVSLSSQAYRPSACIGGDGNLYVTYDMFNGRTYHMVVRVRCNDKWSDEKKISISEKDWAANGIVVSTHTGATVGWYDFGAGATFSYISADLTTENGELKSEVPITVTKSINWYQNISLDSNKKGISVFAYTWGKTNINVRYRKGNGNWSTPVIMSYNDTHCAVHPRVMIDDNNIIHLVWQFSSKNGHKPHRNSSIIYNKLTIAEMDQYANNQAEEIQDTFVLPIDVEKSFDKNNDADIKAWMEKNGYADLQVVFGDIHGQSGISDGIGEIDQYYNIAKVGANLDFTALTDHDCYPDWISQSEWEWIRTTNRLFNIDGEFASLLAYEWTPNEYRYDFGHKNVYYRGDDGEVFRSCDAGGMTPHKLFESLKKYNGEAMAIPHHPAASWTLVSAATDWNFHDEEIQRLVEIFSRHAPFEYYGNKSKYTKNNQQIERCSVKDALAKGYHLGFTAGSDSHQMEHGIEGGIMSAFVPSLTRENVYDAMYDRFVYGTTGARILVSLKINGHRMGQVVQLDKDENVEINISVLGTDTLKVELIKNNQVIVSETSDTNLCDFVYTDKDSSDADFYYIRVTQNDEHQAWSSPIWVESKK